MKKIVFTIVIFMVILVFYTFILASRENSISIKEQSSFSDLPNKNQAGMDDTAHTLKENEEISTSNLVHELRMKAQEEGAVLVIVGVAMTVQDQDDLSAQEWETQQAALRQMQDAVINRVFINDSESADRATRFKYIPFVSMKVNSEQLERLLHDKDVTSIEEEVPDYPA